MLLPRKIQLFFANLLGFLFLISGHKRNKYSKMNIKLCFPDLDSKSE